MWENILSWLWVKEKTLKQWSKDNSQLSQNFERKKIFWVFIALYISFTHKYIALANATVNGNIIGTPEKRKQ